MHLLGEVEVVFGFWAFVLLAFIFFNSGPGSATHYLEGLNFTEPAFVFVIMVVAASRPILELLQDRRARRCTLHAGEGRNCVLFRLSFDHSAPGFFHHRACGHDAGCNHVARQFLYAGDLRRLKYATLGVLFVNVSIGGTLTPFAAPPVLMVAGKWNWDIWFMLANFGWKAAVAVTVNAMIVTFMFKSELNGFEKLGGAMSGPCPTR